jgi:cell wall-associated NlpC family hydrolase
VAKRSLRHFRPFVLVASLLVSAAVVPQVASAAPDAPKAAPTVASVQRQLGRLALKNSQLVEKYNEVRVLAAKRKVQAAAAARVATKAKAAYDVASIDMSRTLTAQYEGTGMSAAGALLTSTDGQSYLDRLDTLTMLSNHTAQVMRQMTLAKKQADRANANAKSLMAKTKKDLVALKKAKVDVRKQIAKYEATLGLLTVRQQAAYSSGLSAAVSTKQLNQIGRSASATGSPKAAAAIRFALAQVGKPYVFGAAGPGAYDCSGLTMAAWRVGGVSLPHSAREQAGYGTSVSVSQLRPGDLVFWYSPIAHVAMYIGAGMIVEASQPGEPVGVRPLYMGGYAGAVHLG